MDDWNSKQQNKKRSSCDLERLFSTGDIQLLYLIAKVSGGHYAVVFTRDSAWARASVALSIAASASVAARRAKSAAISA